MSLFSFSSQPIQIRRGEEYQVVPPNGQPHSIAIPGSQKPDRSPVYRHWKCEDGIIETLDPAVRTAHEMFESTAARVPNAPCLGYRPYDSVKKTYGPYEWIDYGTVRQRRADIGVGIVELHRKAGNMGQKLPVGLWCQNRPEWQLADLACMSQSFFTVSLYDTLGPEASEYIVRHAELTCVMASLPHVATLLRLKPRLPSLKFIISLDPLDAGEAPGLSKRELLSSLAAESGLKIYDLDEVEKLGASLGRPYNPPQPSDKVTINYTSGTTGPPKGVILSHSAAVAATSISLSTATHQGTDVVCSYLPLAHIYERMTEHAALWGGARIGFFHGNILELVDDFKELRPTTLCSVPRLYNRFGGAIRSQTVEQPGFKGALSRHIVNTKIANVTDKKNPTVHHALYDRIWGKKVAGALGLDRCKQLVSGSAPLDPSLHQFLRIALSSRFIQGYGMTETYATSLGQLRGDYSVGNCGAIAPCTEACLLSVPDMEYTVDDKPYPRGELLIRGAMLFDGYYKNEEETEKSMTKDGWFKTGDICSIDELGRFSIIDRRKNVLKLAQGEYISPEQIEGKYLNACSYLAQAYVHGDSLQSFLVALFGVQPDVFAPFASKVLGRPVSATNMEELKKAAADDKIRQAVLRDLDRVGRKSKFAGYERVRNCYLYVEPFTIENELLTPTLKLKRAVAAKRYRKELDELYAEALEKEKAGNAKAKL